MYLFMLVDLFHGDMWEMEERKKGNTIYILYCIFGYIGEWRMKCKYLNKAMYYSSLKRSDYGSKAIISLLSLATCTANCSNTSPWSACTLIRRTTNNKTMVCLLLLSSSWEVPCWVWIFLPPDCLAFAPAFGTVRSHTTAQLCTACYSVHPGSGQ